MVNFQYRQIEVVIGFHYQSFLFLNR